MIRPIVLWGSEVLETPAEPITNITDAEIKLVKDMIETMYKAPGVGLAAPQIGISKRIMVTDTTSGEQRDHLFTLFNPEIVSSEGEQFEDEGCLSIPGFPPSFSGRRRLF
jgi:peptide deformylase